MKPIICLIVCSWFAFGALRADAQVQRVTMLGGPPTGVFGIFATGISTYLSKSVPNLEVSHAAGEGAVANIRRVHAGDAEMGLSFASDLDEAFHGRDKFKGKPTADVGAVGLVFIGVARLVTHADSRIRTIDDLAGKRVAVGAPGTGTFAVAERLFRAFGTWDRITRVPLLGAAAGEALSEGKADAFFWNGPSPDRVTTEAATKRPVHIVDLYNPASKTDFFKEYPYFTKYVIPAGSYTGVTQDVSTFGISILWFAHRDVSAPLLQKMVATVYSPEGNAHMLKVHAAARDMTPQKALLGITIPLHKGAEAHWRSVGLEIPELLKER
jgi:TRAP transporter TAXI family solute receptor